MPHDIFKPKNPFHFDRSAKWIWLSKSARPSHQIACFRRTFNLKATPKTATLHITADARYEVYINGQFLGHGPVRSWPQIWSVDQYDLAPLLKPGQNVIAILVIQWGISTFQYINAEPGLLAELKIAGNKNLVTDASWKALAHEGYAHPTPRISCQQGWEEQFDARIPPSAAEEWTQPDFDDSGWPRAFAGRIAGNPPHEQFELRDIPALTYQPTAPIRVLDTHVVNTANYTWSLNPRLMLGIHDRTANQFAAKVLLVTHVHSPTAQSIQLHDPNSGATKWKLNGKPVEFDDHTLQSTDGGVAHMRLKKGWNTLMAHPPVYGHQFWATINLWADKPLRFAATPDDKKSRSPWLAVGPFQAAPRPISFDRIFVMAEKVDTAATAERFTQIWERGSLSPEDLHQNFCRPLPSECISPTNIFAVAASERIVPNITAKIDEPTALLEDNADWTMVYPSRLSTLSADEFDFSPSPGTPGEGRGEGSSKNDASSNSRKALTLALSRSTGRGDKHQRAIDIARADIRILLDFGKEVIGFHEFEIDAPAGTIIDFHNFEFIQRDGRKNLAEGMNNSFRYICHEGINRYRTIVRRGFRYSWMSLRNFHRPVRIRFVRLRMSTYPFTNTGEFACSDAGLTEIWKAGVHSVRCCAEDTYTDCPTYEQTLWVGDARNEALVDLIANGDPRLSRRCLVLTGRSLMRSSITESQVPSGWQNILPTWTFLWMRWAQEHYLHTGDQQTAKELLDYLDKNFQGIRAAINSLGLFEMHAWNLFDWAPMDTPAKGIVTHVSCQCVQALNQSAELADALNQKSRAADWRKLAKSIAAAINKHLWSQKEQAYIDCIRPDGTPSPVRSQQTHTAAYISGVATGQRADRCRQIIHKAPKGFVEAGSPFFMFFLLEALVRQRDFDGLISTIRDYWGKQIEAGATTFWEMYHPSEPRLTRSHCHGWSAAPVVFLTQHVLGIQPAAPGYKKIRIAPNFGDLHWAQGRVPTPHGVVSCSWKRTGNQCELFVEAPPRITVEIQPPAHWHKTRVSKLSRPGGVRFRMILSNAQAPSKKSLRM